MQQLRHTCEFKTQLHVTSPCARRRMMNTRENAWTECIDCGVTSLSRHLHTVLQADRDMPVVYYQWQREVGGGKTRLVKATHRESFSSLVQALEKDLLTFAVHLFNARWQAPAYKAVTTNCPPLFCKDFAEELYMQAARRTTGMSLERHAVRHPPSCGNIPLSG